MDDTRKYELSDLDKMGFLKGVRIFIYYELQPTVDPDKLVSSVLEGVRNANCQLPFMAGDLQFDSGKLHISTPPGSQVEVSVRRFEPAEHKPLSALAKSSFLPDDLDFAQLLPKKPATRNPACAVQLSLIEGGLILGLRMNHAAGDWPSMDTFMSLICQSSKAHQAGLTMPTYTPDLNRAAFNANPTIPRQDLLQRIPMFSIIEKRQFKPKPAPSSQVLNLYRISEPSVQTLKAQCAPNLPDKGVDYITSYDCISALIWTAITRARLHLHPEKASSPTRLIHPINIRARDPDRKTSNQYFGNAVVGFQVGPQPAKTLALASDESLASAAILIRQSINSSNVSSASDLASLMASLAPTETLNLLADFTEMDMYMNTWFSGSAAKYDLGGGSVPAAFRVPLEVAGACVLILPDFSRGGQRVFEVCVQVTCKEQELLRRDAEFLKYFESVA